MVCLGNICRSPSAEAMLRKKARAAGLGDRIEVDSAGTADYHVGSPPDRRSILHGEKRGLEMKGLRGRQVSRLDFERFDLILAMDGDNLRALEGLRRAGDRARIGLLMAYAPDAGSREVPDPYGGGPGDFERVLDLVDAAASGLVEALGGR
ncbi:MAG: low molecular weight protein-tyrosine-phosphatase [Burkholderiaceae bacterium]